MTGIRRALVLIGLTVAVMVGAAIPASATFADSTTVTATIGTIKVAAPSSVIVDDYCITTTTTQKRITYTDPSGVTTQTGYSSTTSEARNTYNEQSIVTTTAVDPVNPNVKTTTTVTKATDLVVNVSWTASGSRGVSGYAVSAHPYGGPGQAMAQTSSTTTWAGARVSAHNLDYAATLSVTTLTSYGWTAQSAQTARLSC